MIRIICCDTDASAAVNIGGPIVKRHKTFDVSIPEMEKWLKEKFDYSERAFVGIEFLD